MSALSQFLLVAWLTPTDFGLFAAANAALIIIVALTNLGEVNAFLTGTVSQPAELLRTTRTVNLALAAAGCLVAGGFHIAGSTTLAWMVLLVSLTIPLTGGSLAWNAVAIRSMDLRVAILGQFAGAAAKLLTGVVIAWLSESSMALPLALGAGAITNIATTRFLLRNTTDGPQASTDAINGRSRFDRIRWGAQSLVQFFGAQSDYLVIALVATPHLLGIYFLAYQATVGLSALVSGPLMKSGLVELGRSKGADLHVAKVLGLQTSVSVVALSAIGAAGVMAASPHFPGAWSAAGAPLVMLLGSLAGRLLTPVLEAQLLASNHVGRSFWANGADIVGTSVAALVVVTGDVLLVALAVSAWKVTVAGLRCVVVFGRQGLMVILPAVTSLVAHGALAFGITQGSLTGAGMMFVFGLIVVVASHFWGKTNA